MNGRYEVVVRNNSVRRYAASFSRRWTFDNDGRTTSVQYPTTLTGAGPTYSITYDTMGRANGMTDQNNNTLVSGMSYGPASELLGMTYLGYSQNQAIQQDPAPSLGAGSRAARVLRRTCAPPWAH
jgi:hypothetical protein